MNYKAILNAALIALLLIGGAYAAKRILGIELGSKTEEGGHGGAAAADDPSKRRGPHGGRYFGEPDFECEVQIYEPEGVTPEFHVYFYKDGQPFDPKDVKIVIKLERINRTDTINFKKEADYYIGDGDVVEPHSFHAFVNVQAEGRTYEWKFDSIEGRAEMPDEILARAGVEMVKAGPAKIRQSLSLRGRVQLNEQTRSVIHPRFPGVVKTVTKELGDMVKKGDVLATVESNESLQTYEVKADSEGTVIEREVRQGGFVDSEDALFVIVDLSQVWVDFIVHRKDFPLLKAGQAVTIHADEGIESVEATLSYLSPFSAEGSQTMMARAVVPNPKGELRPGLFLTGDVVYEEAEVPVAVKTSALQSFRDWDVVFVRVGTLFEAMPFEIGRRDAEWIEVKAGIPAGISYAAENSFIIKADVMKGGATHDH
ncbi:efflux RND transporter periplasmic adaptor subunit [Prosthecobacter dejongeii]|uniref:Cobalt-zinc-cadmium efflux system membrane fusion protein n=1 Tax=Prosthecobacter dejongeii TaxID=48465 RepID=A0A7W8DPL2_9BACT|nr:efflux RND transporter periplasmic adaptor subunit [Prosthecobacter dejongeii]MBB5037563.1 cobalt-zinc-cadmium efflux system membrane fusion protein [Prosthecobacter dejongeii]